MNEPLFKQIPSVKIMLSVGCLFDIPTGTYLDGVHGEKILNGGIGNLNGIVGVGNCFKSTITHYIAVTAAYRAHNESRLYTYDTETNMHPWHLGDLSKYATGEDWVDSGRWSITDNSIYEGDAWYDIYKDYLQARAKDKKALVKTNYRDRDGSNMMTVRPDTSEVDSFSNFSTSDVVKMQDDNKLGEKGANTMYMRQGLQKSRFLTEMQKLSTSSGTFMMLTAHFGEKMQMDQYSPNLKKLQYVKQGQDIKGVPPNFTFFMNTCWQAVKSEPLFNNTSDRKPMYPFSSDDNHQRDTDLNEVTLLQLRCKSGPSGNEIKIIVSQTQGVLPSLSEFHYLKTNGRFGLPGNDQNYACSLLPNENLSRTTIRSKLQANHRLARAINICSELLQMIKMWLPKNEMPRELVRTPDELYAGIQAQGYDWDMILNLTRGYTSFDPNHELLELSTWDLLRMCIGQYHPYWLESDKKTIKKEYRKNVEHRLNPVAPVAPVENKIVRDAKEVVEDKMTDEQKLEIEMKKSLTKEVKV